MDENETTPRAKYAVGDKVHCRRKETDSLNGFDFKGRVEWVNLIDDVGPGMYEYRVENAPVFYGGTPCLVWEEEIVGLVE